MAAYEQSIVIDAPVSEVFKYVNEPTTTPDWLTGMVEVRNIIGSGEGQQYEWSFKMVGVRLRGQTTVVNYIENECAAHQSIGMVDSVWTNIVEPHDSGTKLTIKIEYSIPGAVLGKLAEHLTLRRNMRGLDVSVLNVKETLEG